MTYYCLFEKTCRLKFVSGGWFLNAEPQIWSTVCVVSKGNPDSGLVFALPFLWQSAGEKQKQEGRARAQGHPDGDGEDKSEVGHTVPEVRKQGRRYAAPTLLSPLKWDVSLGDSATHIPDLLFLIKPWYKQDSAQTPVILNRVRFTIMDDHLSGSRGIFWGVCTPALLSLASVPATQLLLSKTVPLTFSNVIFS